MKAETRAALFKADCWKWEYLVEALYEDHKTEREAAQADWRSGAWWSKHWTACQVRAPTQGKIWKDRQSVENTTLRSILHVDESANQTQLTNTIANVNMSIDFGELFFQRTKVTFDETAKIS